MDAYDKAIKDLEQAGAAMSKPAKKSKPAKSRSRKLPCAVCGTMTTGRRVEEAYLDTAKTLGSTRGLPTEGYCTACRRAEKEFSAPAKKAKKAVSGISVKRGYVVMDYNTAQELGKPTVALFDASMSAGDTGAVPAVRRGNKWHYVQPYDVDNFERQGEDVRTVYVMKG